MVIAMNRKSQGKEANRYISAHEFGHICGAEHDRECLETFSSIPFTMTNLDQMGDIYASSIGNNPNNVSVLHCTYYGETRFPIYSPPVAKLVKNCIIELTDGQDHGQRCRVDLLL